ncbi:MAG: J domain-containing protein [Bacteriovoracaceae bacterium]|jgi:hypothetical protein|nr:J domain-containing protein [Bacteriovoracaceae bacterium]
MRYDKMLLAVLGGFILSFFMASLLVKINWTRFLYDLVYKNCENWERSFNKMIRFETLKLGNLIRSNPFTPQSVKKEKQIYKNTAKDKLAQKIKEQWYSCDSKTLNSIRHHLKDQGHLDISGLPIKMLIKEIIVQENYNHIKGNKLSEHLLSKLYIKTLKEEILRESDLNERIKLNEDINLHNAVILLYIHKLGASEKVYREQLITSPKSLILRLKSFSVSQLDIIDREILLKHTTIKSFYNYLKMAARKQKKFETDFFIRKEKAKNKENYKSKSNLTPAKVQDALKILEMSRIVDLNSLKKNYKKMAMRYHPDRIGSESESESKVAHEKFVNINNAYQTLTKKCS